MRLASPIIVWLALTACCSLSAKTVLDGAYTDAQAARGQVAFMDACSRCHGDAMNGGSAPPLITRQFLDHWRDDDLEALFIQVSQRMPPGGSRNALPEATSVDIVAAILKSSGFPAGSAELTRASLAAVQLVGKDGPQPLPTNSLVSSTGCLTAGANGAWTLTAAVEPVRTKVADSASPAEIAAAAQHLGAQTFRLTNVDTLDKDPAPLAGHQVLAKGALARQAAGNRISVVSVTDVKAGCAP